MIETLAIQIRENPRIQGIMINGKHHLVSLFADDLALFLKFQQKNWNEVLTVFTKFKNTTGMKINYYKSTVYRIGSLHNSNAQFYSKRKLEWTNEPIEILGIIIAENREKII